MKKKVMQYIILVIITIHYTLGFVVQGAWMRSQTVGMWDQLFETLSSYFFVCVLYIVDAFLYLSSN